MGGSLKAQPWGWFFALATFQYPRAVRASIPKRGAFEAATPLRVGRRGEARLALPFLPWVRGELRRAHEPHMGDDSRVDLGCGPAPALSQSDLSELGGRAERDKGRMCKREIV